MNRAHGGVARSLVLGPRSPFICKRNSLQLLKLIRPTEAKVNKLSLTILNLQLSWTLMTQLQVIRYSCKNKIWNKVQDS